MSIFTTLFYPLACTFQDCTQTTVSPRTSLYQLKQKLAKHFQDMDLSDQQKIYERLRTLPITVAEVRACIEAPSKDEKYSKTVMLQLPNGAYIAILLWNFGLGYGQIHDHSEADCFFTCLNQAVCEQTYKTNKQGILQKHQKSIVSKGMVRYLPKGAIHKVKGYAKSGIATNQDCAITAHLYTGSTEACNYYEEGQFIAWPEQRETDVEMLTRILASN